MPPGWLGVLQKTRYCALIITWRWYQHVADRGCSLVMSWMWHLLSDPEAMQLTDEQLFQNTNTSSPQDSLLRLDFPLRICNSSFKIECICPCAQNLFLIMDSVTVKEVTHEPRYLLEVFLQMGVVLAALQASGRAAVCKGGQHAFASRFADSHLRDCYPVLVYYQHYRFGSVFLVYWS